MWRWLKLKAIQGFKLLGWLQLNVILGVIYFLVLTPYAWGIRWFFRMTFLTGGTWQPVDASRDDLEALRRSY